VKGTDLVASVQYEEANAALPWYDKPAVNELNLSIADGELLVLVGPSGSQVDSAPHAWRARAARRSKIMIGGKDVSAVRPGTGHRDGVPELRALPAARRAANMALH